MENVATDEDWKVCFAQLAPGLLLFARQWVRSPADAEDVVQEAFVRLWRRNYKIDNPERIGGRKLLRSRALLYATVRSIALDFIRRDKRRARRESDIFSKNDQSVYPKFETDDESQQ